MFRELPYWKTNLLRHNLDIMHIEKNVFENIFNTIMDVKGKKKDNIKARLDVALFCNRKNMELVCDRSRVVKARASFVLEKNAQLLVYKWLKSLCFPDGHALIISRLVNTEECRLYGMKIHDCHVFMQTLIPLAFRDLLPKGIWDALMEINHFFRDICSSKLNVDHIERLEKNIVETVCKLEMIFPSLFFDLMEHLPVHLSFKVKVGRPVQYRWMYSFERLDIT
jgi:predicted amino acid-binding ACT domain protein